MKSQKPNDPRRLTITGYGRPKAKNGSLYIPVHVEYNPWCCTEAHEYAHAFKAISDLFEGSADNKAKREYIAASLEGMSDAMLRDDFKKSEAIDLLYSVAQYLKEMGEEEYH